MNKVKIFKKYKDYNDALNELNVLISEWINECCSDRVKGQETKC